MPTARSSRLEDVTVNTEDRPYATISSRFRPIPVSTLRCGTGSRLRSSCRR